MNEDIEKKVILEGDFEDIIQIKNHYYIVSKKNRVIVLPYSIDSKGLLDKIGVIKDYNYIFEEYDYTLLNDYINEDDGTNLVAANRVLYNTTKLNITNADDWMYLGSLYNNLTSDSVVELYCVNITDKEIKENEEFSKNPNFKMIDSSLIITSDDTLLLAGFLRLWNYFYVNSLNKKVIKNDNIPLNNNNNE
ncbi:hypothetical protein M0Q50_09780 [bacterium]|jgi:hypothetical protein|nr:hypothetical protein [bacterium]